MNLEGNSLGFRYGRRSILETQGAEVFAADNENNPCFTGHQYGKGKVYYLNFPLEKMILNRKNWFEDEYYRIYKKVFEQCLSKKKVLTNNTHIAITEHSLGDETAVVIINYSDREQKTDLMLNDCTISAVDYGDAQVLQPFSACVLRVKNSKR